MSEILKGRAVGLRERKKQRTRWAFIDAALDLFLTQGYEATTIDEIVAAVDVSQRTFFRYFAGKEDVALSFLAEYDEIFIRTLAGRPPAEPPVAALRAALNASLSAIEESDEEQATRFCKLRCLIDGTPALAAGQLRRFSETEQELATIIARRMGTDLAADVRPYLLVASFLTVVRVAFDGCARGHVVEPAELVPRVKELVALAVDTLPGAWSAG
jgi:AcrR family transcriptional regulator